MQPDRGLVQDIKDADQARAHLRRQADALGLAARERGGGPVEREVFEPDVREESETPADLLQELVGDVPREVIQRDRALFRTDVRHPRQPFEERRDPADRHGRQLDERPTSDPHGAGSRVDPRAEAFRAGPGLHELFEIRAERPAGRFLVRFEEIVDHAVPEFGVSVAVPLLTPSVDDHPAAGAVEPGILGDFREILPRPLEQAPLFGSAGVGFEVRGHALEDVPAPLAHLGDLA